VAEAQFELARLHLNGGFEGADETEGRELLIRAANNGWAEAFMLLESLFLKLLASAKQGDADAQAVVGSMYFDGQGVEQDDVKASRWWRKAAEQGDADSQFSLGLQYVMGIGVTKDHEKAATWLNKAARQGHDGARRKLEELRRRAT
jgi:TPR repeat protein